MAGRGAEGGQGDAALGGQLAVPGRNGGKEGWAAGPVPERAGHRGPGAGQGPGTSDVHGPDAVHGIRHRGVDSGLSLGTAGLGPVSALTLSGVPAPSLAAGQPKRLRTTRVKTPAGDR